MLQFPNQWVTEENLPRVQRTGRGEDHSPATPFHEYAVTTLDLEGALLDYDVAEYHRSHESFGGVCRLHLGP